ncbi:MAG: hypothetical protein ACRC9X_04830 [Bacteroidales bacterium]
MQIMQGYFTNADSTAIVSMHKVLDAAIKEVPENFYETPILDPNGECLRLVNDNGNVRIEVVEPYVPSTAELQAQELQSEVTTQQRLLDTTDYKVIKAMEAMLKEQGLLSAEIAEREAARESVRKLLSKA